MALDVTAALQASRPAPEEAVPGPVAETGFHRLLVPLDGSAIAEGVLPFVRRLANPGATTIVVLQAVALMPIAAVDAPAPAVLDAEERTREEARRYVEGVAARLGSDGYQADALVRDGDPSTVILDLVRELNVDLIAMTTHGRTGLRRLVFGSVAERVLRDSPVPVFVVRMAEAESAQRAA
jgi:nucleotide-binding universal stress UspA family protein